MGNSALRIAVVGAGRIGSRHIELINASAGSQLASVVDPVRGSSDLAAQSGVAWHADLAQMLAIDRPDGIILATPNAAHVGQALECIGAGVPVLIEKPIATSARDGERLASAARAAGVPVLVGHHRRHSPLLIRARDALHQGLIGDLVAVAGLGLFYKPDDYFAVAPWRRQPGGGPILINLIHAIDDLRFLCGEIDVIQALASNARRGFEVEDTVAVGLRFRSGALGSFLLSDTAASPWSWEQTAAEDAAFVQYANEDCYRLVGTQGSLAVPSLRRWSSGGQPSWHSQLETGVVDAVRGDPMALQLQHFEAVVRGEASSLVPARDATQTLRATLAVAQSAKTGRAITVERSESEP